MGRDPESDAAIDSKLDISDHDSLIKVFVTSKEFLEKRRFDNISPPPPIKKMDTIAKNPVTVKKISELPEHCFNNSAAKKINGTISYPLELEEKLSNIKIGFHGDMNPSSLQGVEITLQSIPSLFIDISHNNQKISYGKSCSGRWIYHLWGAANVNIGNAVTSNGVECFINDGGSLIVGNDCMFATARIHVGDNHAIFDLETGNPLNYSTSPSIVINDHVWVASNVMIRANTTIAPGCILGANSIVKGNFPRHSLITGCPAKTVKSNVSWTRSHDGKGYESVKKMLESL